MAGRPKKATVEASKEANVEKVNEELKVENNNLQSQIDELKNMMSSLISNVQESKAPIVDASPELDEEYVKDVPLNKVIKVVSLYTGGLNLKTADNGKVYRFNNFGQMRPIVYNDLSQILAFQSRFAEEGYFMVLDKDVINAHALESHYKKFLTREQIENILSYDDDIIRQWMTNATNSIKISVIELVIKKIKGNDPIDKNKVHVLNDVLGVDLFDYANDKIETLINN